MPMIFTNDNFHLHTKHLGVSECHYDMFDSDELKELETFMFKGTTSHRYSDTGNLFFAGNFKNLFKGIIYHKVKNIIPDVIPDIVTVGGNFFHTPHQYGIHTDMPEVDNDWGKEEYTLKSLLIPLYKLPHQAGHNVPIKMIFYDQRVIDSGCTFDYGPFKSTTHYRSFTDYSLIDNVYDVNRNPIPIDCKRDIMSEEDYERYGLNFAPSPIERYHGLTVENAFDWEPGSLMVFDTSQVHSSTLGDPYFRTKAGLRISFIGATNRKPLIR